MSASCACLSSSASSSSVRAGNSPVGHSSSSQRRTVPSVKTASRPVQPQSMAVLGFSLHQLGDRNTRHVAAVVAGHVGLSVGCRFLGMVTGSGKTGPVMSFGRLLTIRPARAMPVSTMEMPRLATTDEGNGAAPSVCSRMRCCRTGPC